MRHLEHSGGYYGGLEAFGKLSRLLQFQSGTGLPGLALERGVPQVIEREGQSNAFIRASIARDYGIETGIAIPIFRGDSVAHVLVLLSTSTTPIARAFEVWAPEGEGLVLRSSHYATGLEAFAQASAKLCFKPGEGLPDAPSSPVCRWCSIRSRHRSSCARAPRAQQGCARVSRSR